MILSFLRNLMAALTLAALGAYLLRFIPGLFGSVGGCTLILGALCIAFPTQMHDGSVRLREALVLILPMVLRAAKGETAKCDAGEDSKP